MEEPEEIWEVPLDQALIDAAGWKGNHEEVKRLLAEGANPNWPNPYVVSGSHWLVDTVTLNVVSHRGGFALQHGETALHRAAFKNHPNIVKTLLARGAEVEKRNKVSYASSDCGVTHTLSPNAKFWRLCRLETAWTNAPLLRKI